nr:hypothetical protein [Azospirillum sp. 412522]
MPVMNVAVATSTVSRPFAFMTPRGSDAVETGAGTRTPTSAISGDRRASPSVEVDAAGDASAGGADPLVNRFPTIAYSYDTDASRLVMLYRDPANGKTVSQIPTESALKQYKEAQQKEKDAERASLLKLTVGGNGQGSGPAGGQSAAYGRSGGGAGGNDGSGGGNAIGSGHWAAGASGPAAGTAAPVASTASARPTSVAHSSLAAAASAGTSAARVNVVI